MLRPSRWWATAITLARFSAIAPTMRRELPRPVRNEDLHDEVAPRDGEPEADDGAQRGGVDVPTSEHRRDEPLAAGAAGEDRGHRRRSGALDDELRALEQQHDRLRDLLVVDHDDVVEQVAEDRGGELAGMLHGDPVRDGRADGSSPASGAHAADCTPTSRSSGRSARSAIAMPDARPPPPDGDHDGAGARAAAARRARDRVFPDPRSRADPRTGARRSRRMRATIRSAAPTASSKPSPASSTSAPYPRAASTFAIGAPTRARRWWPGYRPREPPTRPPGRGCRRSP